MSEQFVRSEILFGAEAMQRLHDARVAVFGVGGVGGYVVEALARSGIGTLDIISFTGSYNYTGLCEKCNSETSFVSIGRGFNGNKKSILDW